MATDRPPPAVTAVVVAFVLPLVPVAGAKPQAQAAQVEPQTKGAPLGGDFPAMGVSLDRIRRLLRETPPTKLSATSSLLKLEYHIEVVGKAPRIEFFKDFDIGRATAVRYGGMTHAEFLRVTAPPWRKW
jgi:hypothetical protein